MTGFYTKQQTLSEFELWQKKKDKNGLFTFTLELTARCNNNCRHCYINVPENDYQAKAEELSFEEIRLIVDQAVELGAVWCLVTGGEPLLRDDFEEIYLYLKRKGLLISVFTNATLINQGHIELFRKYPPRNLEVTVYGVTPETYTAVTRKPRLFDAFLSGVGLLFKSGVRVSLKSVIIRSNLSEFKQITKFCRENSSKQFRFDPLIHLRLDRDEERNKEICNQRLTAKEIAELEISDKVRYESLKNNCGQLVIQSETIPEEINLFNCGIGKYSFVVSHNGYIRLCSSLWHHDYMCDLRSETVKEALARIVPQVRSITSSKPQLIRNCAVCKMINLCMWCPAHVYLESGHLDKHCNYFCEVAKERCNSISNLS